MFVQADLICASTVQALLEQVKSQIVVGSFSASGFAGADTCTVVILAELRCLHRIHKPTTVVHESKEPGSVMVSKSLARKFK